jgi:diguanylate cyclase (GGDEF)-like protein
MSSSWLEKIDKLEAEISQLELENHALHQKVNSCDIDTYKYKEVQKLAKAGTWEFNNITCELSISDELALLLWDDPKDVCDISWYDFLNAIIAEDNRDMSKEFAENAIQEGKNLDFEHHLIRPDGKAIYVNQRCKSFYNSIGEPLKTIGLVHDLTLEHEQKLELKTNSATDELTQLYNRRRINEIMIEQRNIFQRYQVTSSYILLDIDHFKHFNDSFGHQVGDEVLKILANSIKDNIRSTDFSGRRGGGEFLVICPSTPLEKSSLLAEKLRKGFMKLAISTDTVVTASFSVGEISAEESTNAFIKRLDDALSEAKEKGRNRLVKSILPL